LSRKTAHLVPEPRLVMDDAEQAAAFRDAGGETGTLAPVYLFHCAHVSEILRPGDTVVDLGCGPANQLAMIARLHPDVRFIGIDLSEEMLALAAGTVARHGLDNVTLRRGDITRLDDFADGSVDAAYSTMMLHHLATRDQLEQVLRELDRVVVPRGGIYIADFGHLKTERAIEFFACRNADRQPEPFTVDYLNSLRAAFERDDWRALARTCLGHRAGFFTTFAIPFMVAIKSPVHRRPSDDLRCALRDLYSRLSPEQRRDFHDLQRFFRLGGLRHAGFEGGSGDASRGNSIVVSPTGVPVAPRTAQCPAQRGALLSAQGRKGS
jgi:ubiquinone/menaquinone biosynthesis C-methylase UbiE